MVVSVPGEMPPAVERGGFRVVAPAFLVREVLGFYGLRHDLLARVESGIVRPYGVQIAPVKIGK